MRISQKNRKRRNGKNKKHISCEPAWVLIPTDPNLCFSARLKSSAHTFDLPEPERTNSPTTAAINRSQRFKILITVAMDLCFVSLVSAQLQRTSPNVLREILTHEEKENQNKCLFFTLLAPLSSRVKNVYGVSTLRIPHPTFNVSEGGGGKPPTHPHTYVHTHTHTHTHTNYKFEVTSEKQSVTVRDSFADWWW